MTGRRWWEHLDYGFLGLLLLLCSIGLVVLWSASHGPGGQVAGYAARQVRWMAVGAVLMCTAMWIDYRHLERRAWWVWAGVLVLLAAVLLAGHASMGARRWLAFGPFRLQPSELAKLATAVVTARILARSHKRPPYGFGGLCLPLATALVPAGLVLIQPDLGTALLIVAVAGAQILFQGVRRKVVVGCGAALLAGVPLGWSFLREYQRQRILTFLNPERDPLGAGYHIIQSKIAVGSGQLFGKGFLKGTQAHLQFLPERHTDFVFSVLAEEWGFVGSAGVLLLYALLILWGLDIAAKARDEFGRLLAVGLTAVLFLHVTVNVGMVLGLLPVVGVPLPLFSYGGSSVVTTFLIAGLLLNIRMHRFRRL